ncbi:pseudouridine synthase [Aureococcus anophagefferens]|nr:pseudouridine synthase [Aureococcus anophagefferens]
MLVRGAAPGVTRYALRVAYDGTRFKGWQVQPGRARTVQGELNAALRTRFGGADIPTLGASRTDAGINRLLPDDARVHDLRPAPAPKPWQAREGLPWHAIANAAGKRYAYRLTARRGSADPLGRLYRGHVAYRAVDFGRLDDALACFVGEHDFAAFANNAGRRPAGRRGRRRAPSGRRRFWTRAAATRR